MLNPMDEDAEVRAIKHALESYELCHPNAQVTSYRQNSDRSASGSSTPTSGSWTRPSGMT